MALTREQKRLIRLMTVDNPTEEKMEYYSTLNDADILTIVNQWKVEKLKQISRDLEMTSFSLEPLLAQRQELNKIKTILEAA